MAEVTHPDHADKVRNLGTIAGLRVHAITLDCADHPERPKSPVGVNGSTTWVQVGAAPWVRCDRSVRLSLWSDPLGSPWNLSDLAAILAECEVYEIRDEDWPDPPDVLDVHHYTVRLPTAIRTAVARYVTQALGGMP